MELKSATWFEWKAIEARETLENSFGLQSQTEITLERRTYATAEAETLECSWKHNFDAQ